MVKKQELREMQKIWNKKKSKIHREMGLIGIDHCIGSKENKLGV